jgi:glycosyltransferase involved in cell wall biosynthesis
MKNKFMIATQANKIPFFSVIVCTYNRELLLKRALDSLVKQSESDWECIIVDDGSSDNTFELCKYYVEQYPNFKYIFHQNRGQPLSRNTGILASSGIYLTFLDSDDEYEEDHLLIRKDCLIQNPDVDFIHGGVKIIGNEFVPDINNPSKLVHLKDCVIGGTFFIKNSVAIELNGFENIKYGDDANFYEKVKDNDFQIGLIDYPTYIYYRDTPDSLCNQIIELQNK